MNEDFEIYFYSYIFYIRRRRLSINGRCAKSTGRICIPCNCLVANWPTPKCATYLRLPEFASAGSFTIKSNVERSRCLLSGQTRRLSSRTRLNVTRRIPSANIHHCTPRGAKSVLLRMDRKFARKSAGKSRDGFAKHVRQIETIKTHSLSFPSRNQKGFINQFSRYNARLCLGAKTWFNSVHNCSPGIAERVHAFELTRAEVFHCCVSRFDNLSRTFSPLIRVFRYDRRAP